MGYLPFRMGKTGFEEGWKARSCAYLDGLGLLPVGQRLHPGNDAVFHGLREDTSAACVCPALPLSPGLIVGFQTSTNRYLARSEPRGYLVDLQPRRAKVATQENTIHRDGYEGAVVALHRAPEPDGHFIAKTLRDFAVLRSGREIDARSSKLHHEFGKSLNTDFPYEGLNLSPDPPGTGAPRSIQPRDFHGQTLNTAQHV